MKQPRRVAECRVCCLPFNKETAGNDKFCSPRCAEKNKVKKAAQAVTWRPAESIARKHRGAWAEVTACSWLIAHRYEVFRNVSHFGPVDIIGMKDGIITLFDVKLVHLQMTTGPNPKRRAKLATPRLTDEQLGMGVQLLLVSAEAICALSAAGLLKKYETIFGKAFDLSNAS